MKDCAENWFMLVSCDLAGIKEEWLIELVTAKKKDIQAVAFRGEIWEPVPGMFHTSIETIVDDFIFRKKGAIWHVLEKVKTVSLPHPF